ncbi:MAG TPA: glycosyltransferase family 2 protein [Actinomycetota bacterium]|nr:glycosyltransferase family 2 protein [Actinomycetota bacterium]
MTLSYVLPLRAPTPLADDAVAYLRSVAAVVDELLVVDGSGAEVFDANLLALGDVATVTRPDQLFRCANGKVAGVLTGVALARNDLVVIADDDVRYTSAALDAVIERLAGADAVVPQNVYAPLPWHARWDTGRILVHRAVADDMGGTVAIRRDALLRVGGYDGDVLFENLELLRTIRAGGGTVAFAPDVFVRRVPPTLRHFAGQRVRQAYDEFARPWLLAAWLTILPVAAARLRRRGRRGWVDVAVGAAATVALAEAGRRRGRGVTAFDRRAAWWAPVWVLERAICAWLAVASRLRGGVRYAGRRLPRAASSPRELRRQLAGASV